MPTKQDFDRAIKGSQDRIVKEEKALKKAERLLKSSIKSRKGDQGRIEGDKAVFGSRINAANKNIAGNKEELKRFIKLRDKAPSSFKTLKTEGANVHNVR